MAGRSNRDSIVNHLMPAESLTSFTTATEYRIGSCWHCLINVPCPSLLTWLSLCMATLGWSVSGYMTATLIKKALYLIGAKYDWLGSPGIDEICIVTVGIITVCIGIFFLIVATLSSESMSRYSFNSRVKNKTGRCINVVVLMLCYIAVAIWSCICAALMIPMTIIGLLDFSRQCILLEILGFKPSESQTSCKPENEADSLLDLANEALVTLAICLAFAFVVQMSMAAFLVNVSANIRHLKETRYETYNSAGGSSTRRAGAGDLGDTAM